MQQESTKEHYFENAKIARFDAQLASKVKEIIENQWGKHLADIKDLSVGQFHERLVRQNQISYRPTNRFVLQAYFFTATEPRRITFTLTA
ncbi:MAG TPA: hypothetical protein VHD63_21530 [Ktedonobacteraceae bacterium]|nr:hypothetical protein [Ktedonobacteraceae bacterium]